MKTLNQKYSFNYALKNFFNSCWKSQFFYKIGLILGCILFLCGFVIAAISRLFINSVTFHDDIYEMYYQYFNLGANLAVGSLFLVFLLYLIKNYKNL